MSDDLRSLFDRSREIAGASPDLTDAMARGRSRRLWLRLTTTVSMVVVGTAIFGGGLWIGRIISSPSEEPLPPAQQRSSGDFARYEIELGQGFNSEHEPITGRGFVEVDTEDDEVCIDIAVIGDMQIDLSAIQLHMHHEPTGDTLSLPEHDLEDPAKNCHRSPAEVTRSILEDHDEWFVEFHHDGSGGAIRSDLKPLPPSPVEDRVASEVIEHLQVHTRLCRGFDFYFRAELQDGSYRPVQCGSDTRVEDVFTTPPPEDPSFTYVKGPSLVVYGFSDNATRDSWLEIHPVPLGGRVVGASWVVDVLEEELYRRIAGAAIDGAEEAIGPPHAVRIDEHMIEPVEAERPKVTLSEAVHAAREDEEVLSVQLALYSDETTEDVQGVLAWVVTMQRCVEGYGGMHAEPDCEGDQTYVVVDAESGEIITAIVI